MTRNAERKKEKRGKKEEKEEEILYGRLGQRVVRAPLTVPQLRLDCSPQTPERVKYRSLFFDVSRGNDTREVTFAICVKVRVVESCRIVENKLQMSGGLKIRARACVKTAGAIEATRHERENVPLVGFRLFYKFAFYKSLVSSLPF